MSRTSIAIDLIAKPVALDAPVKGLAYGLWARTHKGVLAANVAKGNQDRKGLISGSPQVQETFTTFRGSQDLVTAPIGDTAEMTVYAALRLTSDGSGQAVNAIPFSTVGPSAVDPSRNSQVTIRQQDAGNLACIASEYTGSTGTSRSRSIPYTRNAWMLMSLRVGATYLGARNHTANVLAQQTYTAARDPSIARAKIGSSGLGSGTSYKGLVDIAMVYVFPVLHTADQEAEMLAFFRDALEAGGIAV